MLICSAAAAAAASNVTENIFTVDDTIGSTTYVPVIQRSAGFVCRPRLPRALSDRAGPVVGGRAIPQRQAQVGGVEVDCGPHIVDGHLLNWEAADEPVKVVESFAMQRF